MVDPDKFDLFIDESIFLKLPEGCPFLRYDLKRKAYCTIHRTRPDICREFRCWRLLILNFRGRRAGRIIRRTLCSDDVILKQLWERCIRNLRIADDAVWREEVTRLLATSGYIVQN